LSGGLWLPTGCSKCLKRKSDKPVFNFKTNLK
jgi:hypothetical protein